MNTLKINFKNILLIGFLALANLSFAEGTKEFQTRAAYPAYMQLNSTVANIPFALWDCPADYRLNVRILAPGEKIYLGFQPYKRKDIYYRIRSPKGAIVAGPTLLKDASGTNYINSFAEAVAGPKQLGIAGGYDADVFTATEVGDYYIEFNIGTTVGSKSSFQITFFDITVATGPTAADIKLGRLWSKDWALFSSSFDGSFFVYSDEGVVTKLTFNRMTPLEFHVACNSTGLRKSTDASKDRLSAIGNFSYPQYQLFLNEPDESVFPTGKFGNIIGTPTVSGCAPNYCVNVNVDQKGTVGIVLDLNDTLGYQPGGRDIYLTQAVVNGMNCLPWNGEDGKGNKVKNNTTFNLQIDYYNGITHLPLYDVEDNPNGFKVSLVRPIGTDPKMFWDDNALQVISGIDQKVNYTGCTSTPTKGCHSWTRRGNNNCLPDCPETVNTWWYANIVTKQIVFNAFSVSLDANKRTIGRGAANDTTLCSSASPIKLKATVEGSPIKWTARSLTQTGFSNNTDTSATYSPTKEDLAAGFVQLVIQSTDSKICPIFTDSLKLTFIPVAAVNAGSYTVCENNPTVNLKASRTLATASVWSGGTGSYTPSINVLDPVYTPSATEISNGSAKLTLTTTEGNGICPAGVSVANITISKAPTVNAGKDTLLCANNTTYRLQGSSTVPSVTWSGGSGEFSNINSLNSTYKPTASEITNGVTLTLSASGGACNSVSSTVKLTYKKAPIVDAGVALTSCGNNSKVALIGTSSNSVIWSSKLGGTNFLPSTTILNPTYEPTASEIAQGFAMLYLTTTNNTNCNAETDSVKLTIAAEPVVSVGKRQVFLCANNTTTTLTGSVIGAGGGQWAGAGSFVPNNQTLNAKYSPTPEEIASNLSILVLTSINNGNCKAVTDTLYLSFSAAPIVNAGTDKSVCTNKDTVDLIDASADNSSSVSWTSSGTGRFLPNASTLNAKYDASSLDNTNGQIILTLTGNNTNPPCNPVKSQMTLTFTPSPKVNAGSDQNVCKNKSVFQLNGSSSTGSGSWKGGLDSGFNPNRSDLNATYTPTITELGQGSINLTLTSENNLFCNPVSSGMKINFIASPTISAGKTDTVCANNSVVKLQATSATGAASWIANGVISPSNNSLIATYQPTEAEIQAGTATLKIVSESNGNCNQVSDSKIIKILPSPKVTANSNEFVCANASSISLKGSIVHANGGIWSGGSGSFVSGNTNLNTVYNPSLSEIQAGSVRITLTSTGNGLCLAESTTSNFTITPSPTVSAGADQTVCGDVKEVELQGSSTVSSGVIWSSNGTGTFSPNSTSLSAKYIPSKEDIDLGKIKLTLSTTGSGNCLEVSSQINIVFTSIPVINTGLSQTVCENDFPVQLNATGSIANWQGGNGTFTPNRNTLNATYLPTTDELKSGKVDLKLATIASGGCASISQNLTINLKDKPVVNPGTNVTVCGNVSSVLINGTVKNAGGGIWSSLSDGIFKSAHSTLSNEYSFSTEEKTNGIAKLNLTSTNNGFCSSVSETFTVFITKPVEISAGADQKYCSNNSVVTLVGVASSFSAAEWTGGTGNYTSKNALETKYTPSSADILAGKVDFTLKVEADNCPTQTSKVQITFTESPTVTIPINKITICGDQDSIPIAGLINSVPTGAIWSTLGSGKFSPSADLLSTFYYISKDDITAGKVTLELSTTGNGTCLAVKDKLELTITPVPTLDLGKDITACEDASIVNLEAKVTNATSVKWTSLGDGSLSSTSTLKTDYSIDKKDVSSGLVVFVANTTGNGLCKSVEKTLRLSFIEKPTVSAGLNRQSCENVDSLDIHATFKGADAGKWSTLNGSGTFIDNTNKDTYYKFANSDKTSTLKIVFSTNPTATCSSYSDTMSVNFDVAPTVNAGINREICADSLGIEISGSVTNASGGQWSSNGTGNFLPSEFNLNSKYVPSSEDRIKGKVKIKLTSTGNKNCIPVSNEFDLTITPAPTVSIGNDTSYCETISQIDLSSSFTVAKGVSWISSGTGRFVGSTTSPTISYIPSEFDLKVGSVGFGISTTDNGNCKVVNKNKLITFQKLAIVDAGNDLTVCADVVGIQLNGTIKNKTTGEWTSPSNGGFLPDNKTLNASYFLSPTDIQNGNVTLTLTSTNHILCKAVSDIVKINITPAPKVNAGTDTIICLDKNGIDLKGVFSVAGAVKWSSPNGGAFTPSANDPNVNYQFTSKDKLDGKVTFTIVTEANGTCKQVKDDITVTLQSIPVINAGLDQVVCSADEGVRLLATLSGADSVLWQTSGSGNFAPNSTLSTIYYFSKQDSLAGEVTLTSSSLLNKQCSSVSDQLEIKIDPVPTISIGNDVSICKGVKTVNLSAVLINATGVSWKSSTNGTFSSLTGLSTTYTLSPTDEINGNVIITATTSGGNVCTPAEDELMISLSTTPFINAGNDTTVCSTNFPFTLQGKGFQGAWIGGNGTFSDRNSMSPTYTPSKDEVDNGFVNLTINTINNGVCPLASSTVKWTITPGPSVDAGIDTVMCPNNGSITLYATKNGVTSDVIWSTPSGTGTFSDKTSLSSTFIPSDLHKTNGRANLTLTTNNKDNCIPVSDRMVIIILPNPKINAGEDKEFCASTTTIDLNSSFENAKGVKWSVLKGTSTVLNDVSPTTTYSVSEIDKTTNLSFEVQTTGIRNCSIEKDTFNVSFIQTPTITLGADTSFCETSSDVSVKGLLTNATGISWKSTGDGTFTPSENSLTPVYVLGDLDKKSKNITLSASSTGTGICPTVSASKKLTIDQVPTVEAGRDTTICSGLTPINLFGKSSTSVVWASKTSGTFLPDNKSALTSYIPSEDDNKAGLAVLTITSAANGNCKPVEATATIKIINSPKVVINAGADQTICLDNDKTRLNGFIANANGGIWSTTGKGNFADSLILNTDYTINPSDKKGSIVFTLTSTGNGICPASSDIMTVSFTPIPTVNVIDINPLCGDIDSVSLLSNVTIAGGGKWTTGGTGYFSPSATVLNPQYVPSDQDRDNGSVGFTLVTTDNGTCKNYSDTTVLTLTERPKIDAGLDKTICSDIGVAKLAGTVTVFTDIQWTASGRGTFVGMSANGLTGSYKVSNNDIKAGLVKLTATSSGGTTTCKPVKDFSFVKIVKEPYANAGPDQKICSSTKSISVIADFLGSENILWTSTGTGTFSPSATSENAIYILSENDRKLSSFTIKLATVGDGSCTDLSDEFIVNIQKSPTVSAKAAISCALTSGVQLTGTVSGASGIKWTSSGTGIFAITPILSNAIYFVSKADIAKKSIKLYIESSGNGVCEPAKDSTTLLIHDLPTAFAGKDNYICKNASTIILAKTNPNQKYEWKNLTTNVVISKESSTSVTVSTDTDFELRVISEFGCEKKDTVRIKIAPVPVITLDKNLCMNNSLSIVAKITNKVSSATLQWTKNNVLIKGQTDSVLFVQSIGRYKLNYTLGSCTFSDTSLVSEPPILVHKDRIACIGASLPISTSSYPNSTYSWLFSKKVIGSTNPVSIIVPKDTNEYFVDVKLNITPTFFCKSTDSINVVGIEKPKLTLKDTLVCSGTLFTLNNTPSNEAILKKYKMSYIWLKNGIVADTTAKIEIKDAGLYIGTVTVDACSTSDSSKISYNSLPTSALPQDAKFCIETDTKFMLNAGPGENTSDSLKTTYSWNTGETTQKISPKEGGLFIVKITNSNKCVVIDSLNLKDVCQATVFIPSAFLPGKPGPDDHFWIKGRRFVNLNVKIYNRWGELMFFSNDRDKAWDGKFNDSEMPTGVYQYEITYEGDSPEFRGPYKKTGMVTLYR